MSATILVTGATGFTGGQLARRLASMGQPVRALVRDPARAAPLRAAGIELAVGDLCDPSTLAPAMHGIETVYHIAATFRTERISRAEMWQINAEGVRAMLNAAIGAGVQRFVHCSTVGVHGEISGPPADEQTPYAPGDDYQESKTEGERIAVAYMQAGRLPITIFRPGGIYGPGDRRFLKLFRGISRRRFVMIGSGNVRYQLVYIDDLVDGILLCGTHPEAIGRTYILTGTAPVTLNDLVAQIADVLGAPRPRWRVPVWPVYMAGWACELACKPLRIEPPIYRRRVDFFRKDRAFSIARAQRELGYQPKVTLRAGLHRTAAWYRAEGLL